MTYDTAVPIRASRTLLPGDKPPLVQLMRETRVLLRSLAVTRVLTSPLHKYFKAYTPEIDGCAEMAGISPGAVRTAQLLYELAQLGDYTARRYRAICGCTAAVTRHNDTPIHARTLDWALDSIPAATRIYETATDVSVGILGFTGVLSGMVPGAYSVTINYAPPVSTLNVAVPPSILLRQVLENYDTYDEAVRILTHHSLAAPVFYTVCGIDRGCVIERLPREYAIRELPADAPLIHANRYMTPEFTRYNPAEDDEELVTDSPERIASMRRVLRRKRRHVRSLLHALRDPVINEGTQQRMLFVPADGFVQVLV